MVKVTLSKPYKETEDKSIPGNTNIMVYITSKNVKVGRIGLSFINDKGWLNINNFEIFERYREQGYGEATLFYVIDLYKDKYNKVYCYVDKNNYIAINLYNKIGKVYPSKTHDYYYVELYKDGGIA